MSPTPPDGPIAPSAGPDAGERTFVIGTAGHVDHGKSTLVKALTGIDPDRLLEEKTRAMTIDLGFAWMTLPSGRSVSIVDVPGHERFIKNMLAGVGGLDLALLVVAADEGPMPQTAEHLAILDLLGVAHGLIVLTKTDAVDPDWLDLVREETREQLTGTVLAEAPFVAVSALTGFGLDQLRTTLDQTLANIPARPPGGWPRLQVDRVFTVAGFGTVVTGTLIGGELVLGQDVRVFPRGLATRVRGLQTHQTRVERALPGSRVAINLSGLAVDDLRRGDVIAPPLALTPTQRVDARLRLLPDSPVTLEQNAEVDFFVGAAELPARLTLLDRNRLTPGDAGWVQVRFREPLAVLKGDRFIIRRPSPSVTIGGGEIVDATPPRHRRFRSEVLESLETLAAGSADENVLRAIATEPRQVRQLRTGSLAGLGADKVDAAIDQLIAEGDALVLGGEPRAARRPTDFVLSTTGWAALHDRLLAMLGGFHAAQPLRRGMPKEELKSRLKLPPRLFDEVVATVARQAVVVDDGQTLRLAGFRIELEPSRRLAVDRYLAALTANPNSPPAPTDYGLEPETVGALEDLGEIVKVADGVVFTPIAFDTIVRETLAIIDRDGTLTLAGFRDHFQTSRKYAQAVLEYLDQRRITRRVGDERVRYTGPGAWRAGPLPDSGPGEEDGP